MHFVTFLLPYVFALTLTLIIEGILCWLLLKDKSWLSFTCLVNLLTNPLINALYTALYLFLSKNNQSDAAPFLLLGLECLVWLSEGWLFYRFGNKKQPVSSLGRALFLSLVLNGATYLGGLLLQR